MSFIKWFKRLKRTKQDVLSKVVHPQDPKKDAAMRRHRNHYAEAATAVSEIVQYFTAARGGEPVRVSRRIDLPRPP